MTDTNLLNHYISHYLAHRPAFFSLIRPQEALLFHQNTHITKGPILDFGCGDGFFADMTWGKGTIDVGLDIKHDRTQEAEEKKIYKQITYYDGTTIPYPDNHFQTVVSNCVLEHIPDIQQSLREIYRILKPGGYFLTTVMADKWEDYMLMTALFGDGYRKYMKQKQQHFNLFSQKHWSDEFFQVGFEVTDTQGYLSKRNTQWFDAFHYLSAPSLAYYMVKRSWVFLPQTANWKWFVKSTQRRILPLPDTANSAALFYTLKK